MKKREQNKVLKALDLIKEAQMKLEDVRHKMRKEQDNKTADTINEIEFDLVLNTIPKLSLLYRSINTESDE